jgi:hypothetical protein
MRRAAKTQSRVRNSAETLDDRKERASPMRTKLAAEFNILKLCMYEMFKTKIGIVPKKSVLDLELQFCRTRLRTLNVNHLP